MDVVIIGGGAAGLAAARVLAKAGVSVELLEAQERLGGRILTVEDSDGQLLELGAEFVHGNPETTLALAKEAGLPLVPVATPHWELRNGTVEPADRAFEGVAQLMRQAQGHGEETSVALFLNRFDGNHPLHGAAEYARLLVEGFDAADPTRASLTAIVDEWTGGAGVQRNQSRIEGGYGRLIAYLASFAKANGVEMRLGTTATSVTWKPNKVAVDAVSGGQPYRVTARCAIVTLPLSILQAASKEAPPVSFTPGLTSKADVLDHLIMGDVLRVVLRFREPFWETISSGRFRGAAFFHARDQEFPTFWTELPEHAPVLTAWTGGPRAERLSSADDATIIEKAVAGLGALFGGTVDVGGHLVQARVHNWQRDPFSRGAYSYVAVGGRKARSGLAAALENTLFFAGEATDDSGEAGTVAGALASGERAAAQVLASFKA
jgi:monoamine oxidase